MANIKISDLSAASTPLTGAEEIPVVQSGTTVKATTQDIVDSALAVAVANGGGTPQIISDDWANRPLSTFIGSIFVATDLDQVYRYDGSSWQILGKDVATYLVYTAVISQSGTSAPTEDYQLENTLGFTPTYNYVSPGIYTITNITSAWTNNKTVVFINPGFMPSGFVNTGVALGWERNSSSTLTIKSKNTSTGADANDLIFKATIEIRVYL